MHLELLGSLQKRISLRKSDAFLDSSTMLLRDTTSSLVSAGREVLPSCRARWDKYLEQRGESHIGDNATCLFDFGEGAYDMSWSMSKVVEFVGMLPRKRKFGRPEG